MLLISKRAYMQRCGPDVEMATAVAAAAAAEAIDLNSGLILLHSSVMQSKQLK